MARKKVEYEPVTIAIVRDIHQRGYHSLITNPRVRPDGWVQDPYCEVWYSPDNVISMTTFTPRRWDGNAIEPGTLCAWTVWMGVTSERPTGFEDQTVVILNRNASKKCYTAILPDGSRKLLPERKLVPILGGQNAG